MLAYHRNRGTYLDCVDRYIALTEFCRNQFSEGELPSELISVKPNFLANVPALGRGGSQFIFIGRLDESKGIRTLLGAALLHPDFRLKIVGSGPLQEEVNGAIEQSNQISYLGQLDRSTILREMQSSLALVLPSLWYEAFPMVIVEAFSCGLPVIASNLGSMAEIVEDQRTGLLFDPGNSADLAAKVRWANDNPEKMRAYGMNARQEFEQKYTAERNYEMLMDIYHQAIEHRKGRPSAQWQK